MKQMNFTFPLSEEQIAKKKQLVTQLLKKPTVKEWLKHYDQPADFIEAHSGKFSDWLVCHEKCEHCQGLAFCRQSTPGYVMDLYMDEILLNQLIPCRYQRQKQESDTHKGYYRLMDMPDELLSVQLDQLDLKKESREYRDVISKLVDHLLNEADHKGVYFYGKPGVGKTYLAAALSNYHAIKHASCAFINVPKLIADLKMMFQEPSALEQRIRTLKTVDVLVMDDIGGESMTAWSRDEILLPVLESRMQQRKRTYFTSNYSMLELKDRFETTNNRMKEPIAALRLMERIKALSNEIFVKGESRRI